MLKWLFRSPLSELNLNPTLWRYELQRHQPATSWQQKNTDYCVACGLGIAFTLGGCFGCYQWHDARCRHELDR
jgi:hypothetical protein